MGIGKGGSPTTVTASQNQNVAYTPTGLPLFQQIYDRANAASQTPYQPYTGQLVAGSNPELQAGANTINNAVGGLQNLPQQIQNFQNPYQSQVMDALTSNINETNAQQLQQVRGNAASQHALGGDREAVAESELARQQNLGNSPALANALAGGYSQALNAAFQNYGAGLQGGQAQMNVGMGTQQNQQAQDTAAYQQYLQAVAYPYQQAQFLANIGTAAAGGMGGMQFQTGTTGQVTTPPGLSVPQAALGVGLLGGGLFSNSGQAATGGRINKAGGGSAGDEEENPWSGFPWHEKAADITKNGDITVGGAIPLPNVNYGHITPQNISQPNTNSQSNPLGNIGQYASAGRGLNSAYNALSGFFGAGSNAAIPFSDASQLGGIGSDAAATAGIDAATAADAAATAAALDTVGGMTAADALALGIIALKRGGHVYPKRYADGGSPYSAAVSDIENREDQGGEESLAQGLPLYQAARSANPNAQAATPAVPHFEAGGSPPDYTQPDDPPATFAQRFASTDPSYLTNPTVGGDRPRQIRALQNFGKSTLGTGDDDAEEAPEAKTTSGILANGKFDPAKATAAELMDPNNFKNFAPQRQTLMSLMRDPKTRGDALMEMGLRILSAPPDRSGLGALAQGALGTVGDYNQFSEKATTAQQKAQELAARLHQQSGADDLAERGMSLQEKTLAETKRYHDLVAKARTDRGRTPPQVMVDSTVGGHIPAYFVNGQYFNANTREPINDVENVYRVGQQSPGEALMNSLGVTAPGAQSTVGPATPPQGQRGTPSPRAIQLLKANQNDTSIKQQFDAKYGAGASARVLAGG